jgi:endonuclease YncB( thermonuclease family)
MKNKLLLAFLFILLFALNYNFLDTKLQGFLIEDGFQFVQVERVIDGDTVVVNGSSIRLLGINTPEKGEKYSSEAKEFLEKKVLNKTIRLDSKGKDRYRRELAYLFNGNENINLEIVRNGYANYYFPSGKTAYYDKFVGAWEECIKSGKNLCEKSLDKCANCIEVKMFNYKSDEVIFYNKCSFNCNLTNWEIKDEGRKKFAFEDFILEEKSIVKITNEDFEEKYVWTNSGDTLFLRDNSGKLVLWKGY